MAPQPSGHVAGPRVTLYGAAASPLVVGVAVAADPTTRAVGLRGAPCPDPGTGMLFVFPRPYSASFSLQGMAYPLDVAWLGEDGRVLAVATVPPGGRAAPPHPARFVLETTAGSLASAGVRAGSVYALAGVSTAAT